MRLFYLLILARLIISGRNRLLKNNAPNDLKKGYSQMQIFQPSFDDQSKFVHYIIPLKHKSRVKGHIKMKNIFFHLSQMVYVMARGLTFVPTTRLRKWIVHTSAKLNARERKDQVNMRLQNRLDCASAA